MAPPSNAGGWVLIGAAAVIVALFAMTAGKYVMTVGNQRPPPEPPLVVAATVERAPFADVIEAVGTARANESVTLTASVTETVRRLAFESGAEVEEGQIIAELTNAEENAALEDARARLTEAERQYARVDDLVKRGVAAGSQLDEALAERDRAAAQVRAIEATLDDRLIRAPFAGVVGLRMVSPGVLAQPGDPLATLDDISQIKVDFSVPEIFLRSLRVGEKMTARSIAYPDRVFEGEVETVDTRVDPATRAVTVRALLYNDDAQLRPGMLLTARIIQNERQAPAIPELAVASRGESVFVYRVIEDEGRKMAQPQSVTLGARNNGLVEILEGLVVGDQIVSEGVHRLRPGAPIRLVPPQADAGGRPAASR